MSPQNLHVSQPLGSGSLSGLVESCPAHAQHSVGLSRNLRVDFRSPLSVRARGSSHLSGLNRSLSCRPPARPSCCQAKALVSLASPQGPQSCAGFYTDSESSCFVCVQFYILLMWGSKSFACSSVLTRSESPGGPWGNRVSDAPSEVAGASGRRVSVSALPPLRAVCCPYTAVWAEVCGRNGSRKRFVTQWRVRAALTESPWNLLVYWGKFVFWQGKAEKKNSA